MYRFVGKDEIKWIVSLAFFLIGREEEESRILNDLNMFCGISPFEGIDNIWIL